MRIDSGEVRALVQIAIYAGQRQIIQIVSPAMNLRNDVLNVEHRPRRIILRQVAILASVVSAFSNLCSNLSGDHLAANW